jgi:hypothetical protein
MNSRQKKAALLAEELESMDGVWVVNAMPLRDDARGLRVQILNECCPETLKTLREANWASNLIGSFPRFTPAGAQPASLFEVIIEKDRIPVPTDCPRVSGEIGKREKTPAEVEHIRRYLGWD